MSNNNTAPEIEISNLGTIALITPVNTAGLKWMSDRIYAEPWQWQGVSLAIEHRYAPEIISGATAEGVTVTVS